MAEEDAAPRSVKTVLKVEGMTCGGKGACNMASGRRAGSPQRSQQVRRRWPRDLTILLLSPPACIKSIENGLSSQQGILSVSVALL